MYIAIIVTVLLSNFTANNVTGATFFTLDLSDFKDITHQIGTAKQLELLQKELKNKSKNEVY